MFNHCAEQRQIPWAAFSRGLAVHLAEGHLSSFAAEALLARQIHLRYTGPQRLQLSEDDLLKADRRIAMDRTEHFPMMQNQFSAWADKIEYWDVPDLLYRSSEDALSEIENKVIQLLREVVS